MCQGSYRVFFRMKRELVPLNQRPGTFNNAMSPEKRGPASSKEPARVMRELRLKALTTLRAEMGWTSLPEYPRVCGVVMDWPLQGDVVTAVALRGGDASIYTTGTFGVLGGIGHARIRQAAVAWLQCAEKLFDSAAPTKSFDYPAGATLNFFLIGYDEVRFLRAELSEVTRGVGNCCGLYAQGQRLISEIRMVGEK